MASTANQQQTFPAVPPSLSAGDHEMRDYYAQKDVSRPAINQTPYLTPYLGLRARLSQIWINRWTILLLLVLVRTLIAIASINTNLSSARREALSACTQVENVGSSMASMPHYMSQGVNELTAHGVEKAVNGLMSMMEMAVSGVEEIVIFVIHMLTSTYLCLVSLAISGSLHAAVEIGNSIYEKLNKTIDSVTDNMGQAAKSVTDEINGFLNSLTSLPFADGFKPPQIDLTDDIKELQELKVPSEFQKGLQSLNDSIPTFSEVQNFTDNLIRVPFEEVKKLIRGLESFEFNRTLLPVPQKEKLTFCSDSNGINDFFDDLVEMEITARKIFLAVIIVLAVLVCIPMAWSEIGRYRRMEQRTTLLHKGHDAMDVVYLASRPHSSGFGLWLGGRFGSTRRQTVVRWAVAYATSTPALFLLSLGVAGLFACLCQYILLRAIETKVPELTNQVANFADKVIKSLNNASMSWSTGVGDAVNATSSKINDDMLGWTQTTTTAINGTLNEFVDKMNDELNKTLGGTVLKEPVEGVLHCLLGLKVEAIQKGLTWVKEKAHVEFPVMPNDTFSLGTLAKLSDSDSAAELLSDPSSTTKDEISEAVARLIEKLMDGIRTEAIISTCIIALWVIILLIGVVRACILIRGGSNPSPEYGNAYIADPSMDPVPPTQQYPDTAAPPYEYPVNKAAPYTIQPRPFPTFETQDVSPPESEKVGYVEAHNVSGSVARPNHLRASSHGHLGEPSPMDEKKNPFAD
ncbi:hypothetical protein GQ43DRAFT_471198 [Delitschia confertaspora ATCC 74209]|uniref:Plasma membrane fusion protein PRM1 n=1 Tax=Delitschia confertaspora ATCC 74209 TaxID=1513339 RepID=A0A9P4MTG6_9PLEO|nr:hypothetical protein GQ43DRAFT_471198 [Delitschia confertaspora ATCC 74209]